MAVRFLRGGIKLIPDILRYVLNEKLKRLILSEKRIYNQYLYREKNLNKFNI
jgi:hypothetical protein